MGSNASDWTICKNRVAMICRLTGMTAECEQGSKVNGISYRIHFSYQGNFVSELHDRSPSLLLEKVVAFDIGLRAADSIRFFQTPANTLTPSV